jgi:hypothetical protein
MKIGDLVQLSAYAKKLKTWNYPFKIRDGFGIVIAIQGAYIRVKWPNSMGSILMDRRELKYFSKAK